jgi:hypothetical protein
MKMDLLTNATVVEDAIRFVSQKSEEKERLKSASSDSNEGDKEESREPDCDEDQLEMQEQEPAQKTSAPATNQVF